MIQLLIKADADILLGDDFGRTALWCAANHGRSFSKRGFGLRVKVLGGRAVVALRVGALLEKVEPE